MFLESFVNLFNHQYQHFILIEMINLSESVASFSYFAQLAFSKQPPNKMDQSMRNLFLENKVLPKNNTFNLEFFVGNISKILSAYSIFM